MFPGPSVDDDHTQSAIGSGQFVLLDGSTAKPSRSRGVVSDVVRLLCSGYLAVSGWKMRGDWPEFDKVVLVAAPHTSNWDGINMLAAAGYYRVKLRWMGKKSLTTGPFGGVIKWLGCVPIDRAASNDVVSAMREAFAAETSMVLAIPPEGTRKRAPSWKTGFYHIAFNAHVPILMSVLDYGTKTISLAAILRPGGDLAHDMNLIRRCYVGAIGKHRDQFVLDLGDRSES